MNDSTRDLLLLIGGIIGTGGLAGIVKLWLRRLEDRQKSKFEERQWEVQKMREDVDRLLARIASLDEVKIALEARIDEQNREILALRSKVMALELERTTLEERCAKLEEMNVTMSRRLDEKD